MNMAIFGWDNGLSPVRRQAIILTNNVLLIIRPLEIVNEFFNQNANPFIQEKAFENVTCKKQTFCLSLNMLNV